MKQEGATMNQSDKPEEMTTDAQERFELSLSSIALWVFSTSNEREDRYQHVKREIQRWFEIETKTQLTAAQEEIERLGGLAEEWAGKCRAQEVRAEKAEAGIKELECQVAKLICGLEYYALGKNDTGVIARHRILTNSLFTPTNTPPTSTSNLSDPVRTPNEKEQAGRQALSDNHGGMK